MHTPRQHIYFLPDVVLVFYLAHCYSQNLAVSLWKSMVAAIVESLAGRRVPEKRTAMMVFSQMLSLFMQ